MRTRKAICACLIIAFNVLMLAARAEIEVVFANEPLRVFSGPARSVTLCVHNRGDKPAGVKALIRIYQTSSSTAVLLGEKFWKTIQALPQQTLVETTPVDFPVVRAETRFLLQWLDDTNRSLGKTEVLVYPTNLLAELKTLAGENPPGVLDPDNQLKPLLKNLAVEFSDLEEGGLGSFIGRLAVIGPFSSKAQMSERLADQIAALAKKGKAIVWLQPPSGPRDKLQPSFYAVPEGSGSVVVAPADTVANLAERPQAQLNLIHFARLALHPEPPQLPQTTQP